MQVIHGQQDASVARAGGQQRADRPMQAVALGADPAGLDAPSWALGTLPASPGSRLASSRLSSARRRESSRREAPRRSLRGHRGKRRRARPPRTRRRARKPSGAHPGRGPHGVGQQLRLADPGLARDLDHVRLRRLAAGSSRRSISASSRRRTLRSGSATGSNPHWCAGPLVPQKTSPRVYPIDAKVSVRATSLAGDMYAPCS